MLPAWRYYDKIKIAVLCSENCDTPSITHLGCICLLLLLLLLAAIAAAGAPIAAAGAGAAPPVVCVQDVVCHDFIPLRAHLVQQQNDNVEATEQGAADVELRGERHARVVPAGNGRGQAALR